MDTVREMAEDPRIRAMEQYRQHGSSNTYAHSLHVAIAAYKIAKFARIDIDEKDMARGAMLHDFYLYDIGDRGAWEHGTKHAAIALENSEKYFDLTDIERDIIYSHMWPLNITHLPHYKESVIIGIADKYAAVAERFHVGQGLFKLKTAETTI